MSDTVVRIVIDSSEAERGGSRAEKALDRVGAAAIRMNKALGSGVQSVSNSTNSATAQIDKLTQANNRSASASKSASAALETEAQKTARLSKMIDASIDKLNQQKAAQQVAIRAGSSSGFKVGMSVPRDRDLEAAQNKIMGLTGAGKIPDEILNGTKGLGQAANDVKKVEKEVENLGGKVKLTSGSLREGIVLIREFARGDFSRMAGSASILAQRMGAIEAIGAPLILTFGGIAAAVGVVATAIITGANAQTKLENMLQVTNNAAGLTETSLNALSQNVAKTSSTTIAAADEITAAYASMGKLSSQAIEDLSSSTVKFARLTDQSNDEVIASWQKIADDPIRFAQELSDKYDLVSQSGEGLTATNIELAQRLLDSGDKMAAVNAISADLKTGLDDQADNVGYLTRVWRGLEGAISDTWHALQDWGKTKSPLQAAQDRLTQLQNQKKAGYDQGAYSDAMSGGLGVSSTGGQDIDAAIATQTKLVNGLKAADDAKARSAQQQAAQQAAARQSYSDADTVYKSMIDRTSQYSDALTKLNKDQKAANAELERVKKLPGDHSGEIKAAQSNVDFYNSQHDNIAASLKKQYLPATNKSDNAAESAAKRAAREDAERQKRADKFLKTLDAQSVAAAQTPIQAEITTKKQQLENILGHELTDSATDRARMERLTNDVITERQNKLQQELQKTNDTAQAELDYRSKTLGMTDRQQTVEEAGYRAQQKALEDVGDKTTEQIQKEIERAKVIAGQNYDLQQQARLLDSLGQYSRTAGQLDQLNSLGNDKANLDALRNSGALDEKYGPEFAKTVYEEASKSLADAVIATKNTFKSEFAKSIDDLGDQFGGKFGKAISKLGQTLEGIINAASGNFSGLGPVGGLLNMFSQSNSPFLKAISQGAQDASKKTVDSLFGSNGQKSAFNNPLKSLSDGFGDFKGDIHNLFGKNGDFAKGLGSVLGKGAAGAQMGDQADELMKALGIKSSKTGAEIGGAIGNAVFGPIGGILGSLGGGLLGGLFKKAKQGGSSLTTDSFGNIAIGSTFGNNGKAQQASIEGANSVASGLNSIAQQLGAQITGQLSNIVIGTYNGNWRVNTTGSTKMGGGGGKYGNVDFGKDGEADAIAYAIQQALKQGVLTGLSDFSEQLLKTATDIDAATKLAGQYETVLHDLAAYDDPVGTALDDLKKQFSTLEDQMKANGATAADLANVERDYDIQRKQAMDDALSDLKSFKDKLNGNGSGVPEKTQLDSQLAEFRKYEADLDAGKTVDSTAFAQLGSSIFDLAKDIYGTSTAQFQNIRTELLGADNQAMDNVNSIYGNADGSSAIVDAVDTQTQLTAQLVKEQQKGNAIWQQVADTLQAANDIGPAPSGKTTNARQRNTV